MGKDTLQAYVLTQRLDSLKQLVEVTCDLAAQHDLGRILKTVTSAVCMALRCERASLFLHDEDRRELYTRVVTELEIKEIRASIDQGITGWVARKRQVANIPDPHVDARWNSSVDRKTGFQTRNILAAPVVSAHDERLLGVLELMNRAEGEFDSFDEQVLQAFASHAAIALERAQLLEEARQSHELQLSFEVGRGIQAGFMPDSLPVIPGYELAAWWEPAEAVGGDYYDLLPLPDGRLGLVIADVSGHGIGAALIMASVRAMLHVLARTSSDPGQILSLVAESIMPDLKNGRFITFLTAALNPRTHTIAFANAGHGPALHYRRSADRFAPLASTTLPIGFLEGASLSAAGPSLTMQPGDLLILATDGAIELRSTEGEMFGRQRLERLISEHAQLPASTLVSVLSDAIRGFHPEQHPPDDVTLLILERKLT